MERIFDLPAHPLMIHFPAVAIPALTLLVIALIIRPSWRDVLKHPAAIFAIVTAIATILAVGSGEALAEAIPGDDEYLSKHASLGEATRLLVVIETLALLVMLYVPRSLRDNKTVFGMIQGVVVVLSLLATIWAFRTGHEGARVHWEGVLPETGSSESVETADTETATVAETTTQPSTTVAATQAPTTVTEAPTEEPVEEEVTVDPASIDGMVLYEANCARCHGSDGAGTRGPSLIDQADDSEVEEDLTQILNGGSGMPSFDGKLTELEIRAIIEHYRTTFVSAA